MNAEELVAPFDRIGLADLARVGGKGANLGELTRAGLPVPPGVVVTTAGYDAFVAANALGDRIVELATGAAASPEPDAFDVASARIAELFAGGTVPDEVARAVDAAARDLVGADTGAGGDGGGALAVRSSATAEDLADASFAGQQETFLHVRGPDGEHGADELLAAVVRCWASLWTARALAYRVRRGIPADRVRLAVVVQRMVRAESSGVMFTVDPTTGRRDRLVVSAAWGLGESVVGGTVSTDDHVVDTHTLAVVSRHVASKTVMTAPVDGGSGTRERPVEPERVDAGVLDDAAVVELARLGLRIEEHYGAPQDIEWARADGRFAVVQSRPVTALPEAVPDPPTTWPVPARSGLYFRASIVEQMPDPLTPLFADLVDGSVTRSLVTLMGEALGRSVVRDGDVGLPTVNGYAYYRYATAAMVRMTALTPVALWSVYGSSSRASERRGGVTGWRERSHPRYVRVVEEWAARPPAGMTDEELLGGVHALLDAAAEYYTAVQSVVPVAATSEFAFRGFHDRLVRRAGDPAGLAFLLGLDSEPLRAERSLEGVARAARDDGALAAVLVRTDTDVLVQAFRSGDAPDGVGPTAWTAWCATLRQHLQRHGHTVYNLDFAEGVPADEPGPVLDAVRFALTGPGPGATERQRLAARTREEHTRVTRARLDPVRRAVFDRLLRRAQVAGPAREDALADLGLAWPVMRRMLAELGARLVRAGVVADVTDVFWLHADELRGVVDGCPGPAAPVLGERRREWRARRRAVPPQMLPATGPVHRLFAPWLPGGDQAQSGDVISGVAAGPGRVTAVARVLEGPADFGALQRGEVLVARLTTPAWTPLFARAAAVVTDVGGPLSHSSIVAREYGIPAVLGTGAATTRIRSGRRVSVDGDAGRVTLLAEDAPH